MKVRMFLEEKSQKIIKKKIRIYRKNYMSGHVDDVRIQKVYKSNWQFYTKLLLFPTIITLFCLLIIGSFHLLTEFTVSITIGILGSYIASVVVTWLVDINTCKSKTLERMRFQHVYFSRLIEICEGYIFFYVSYLVKTFPDKCKEALKNGEENYQYFKGHPWQYWYSMLTDLLQKKYPFQLIVDGNLSENWMEVEASYYIGEEYDRLKFDISKEAEEYIFTFFKNSDFIESATNMTALYRTSLADAFVNDYIYYQQVDLVIQLLDYIDKCVDCVKRKRYVDFWNLNYNVLKSINDLSSELYPFLSLRETEHVYNIYYKNGNSIVHFDVLDEYVDDSDNPSNRYIRRTEYWRIRKQQKLNEEYKKENKFTLDNGWR